VTGDDIAITVDFRIAETARAWTDEADRKRPWREQMRGAFVSRLAAARRVLELGSGPGQLAERILRECTIDSYVLLDFAPPMHELARARVGSPAATFVLADFKRAGWSAELGREAFDAIVTMQAVHELRHKRHAIALYREARTLLRPGGQLLVCDHLPLDDTPISAALYATIEEQHAFMRDAGFTDVVTEVVIDRLYLVRAHARS
jgi:SAM-dependent methyltransferase